MKLVNCPTHAMVIDKAKEQMADGGRFSKRDVLSATGFSRYGGYIQWPFVRESVEHELGESLVPIPENDDRYDPEIHPEKFLPGAKRKTAGYARASVLAVPVVETWVQRRFAQAAGSLKSLERLAISCQQQGIPIGFTPGTLPTLQIGISPA